jgi:sialic acid synthase SpsE
VSDVAFRRPGNGLPPKMRDWLLGKTLNGIVAAGEVLALDSLK